jgi:CubicO group peptidase (beta-lactamase class C family)
MRRLIAGILLVASALGRGALAAQGVATPVPLTPPRYDGAIRTSRALVERLVSEAALPGLSVAVAVNGEIVWSEGFGYADVENRIGVTPLTRFRIGSVSKSLTVAGMMAMVEAGRLDLDASIQRHVPRFPDKGHTITARQLAGHLAGVRHYRGNEFLSYRTYTDVVDALEMFARDSLLHPPGTRYTYSSFGYNLLSAVIQGAAREDFLTYMWKSVFHPFDMRHTSADHSDSLIPNRARFYRRDGQLLVARFTDDSYKWASGGFLSTAEDLARFGSGLLAHRTLKRESVHLMFTSQRTVAGEPTGYGMGWRPRQDWEGRPVVHHGGASEGGRAFLLLYPEVDLVIALLSNVSSAPLFEHEAQTIAHFFLEHPRDTLLSAAPISVLGRYRFDAVLRRDTIAGTVEITPAGRRPGWIQWGTGSAIPLVAVDTLHSDHTRLVGVGAQGVLNLWLSFQSAGFTGKWDWLGATVDVRGRRP